MTGEALPVNLKRQILDQVPNPYKVGEDYPVTLTMGEDSVSCVAYQQSTNACWRVAVQGVTPDERRVDEVFVIHKDGSLSREGYHYPSA